MHEFFQIFVINARTVTFIFFEGPPGPGIAISHRGSTDSEGVGNACEGDGAAGDRAQELRDAWDKADIEHLECVAGLQQCPEDSVIICWVTRISRCVTLISEGRLTFSHAPHPKVMEIKDLKVRTAGLEKR